MENSLKENDCYEYKKKKNSIISASFENKTTYKFDNTKKQYIFSKRQIDNCVIENSTACDWLFEMEKEKGILHYIFLELKDSDLIKAIEQIQATIKVLAVVKNNAIIHARIVLTKTYSPDIKDNRVLRFKKEIETKKGTLDYGSQQLNEKKIV